MRKALAAGGASVVVLLLMAGMASQAQAPVSARNAGLAEGAGRAAVARLQPHAGDFAAFARAAWLLGRAFTLLLIVQALGRFTFLTLILAGLLLTHWLGLLATGARLFAGRSCLTLSAGFA